MIKRCLIMFFNCLLVGLVVLDNGWALTPNVKNKRQNVEQGRFGRTVNSSKDGKINYLWNSPAIDAAKKGNSKAKSLSFSKELKDNQVLSKDISQHHPFSKNSSFLFEENWKVGVFGSGIGSSGINAEDIDNDGIIEIIAGGSASTFGSDNFWYILEYSGISNEYSMQWISDFYPEGISDIAIFDANGTFNIFIGLKNGDIKTYDGKTLKEIGNIDSPASSVNSIIFADADNDSVKEIVFCDDSNTFIYNVDSQSLEHQIPYGGSDIEVGNVDSDISNEIVLASGLVLELKDDVVTCRMGLFAKQFWQQN